MRSRLIPVLATLVVAAIVAVAPVPVLAQDSTVRPLSAAVFVHPAEGQSASQSQTTDQSAVMEAQRDRVDWPRVGLGVTVAVGNLFYIPAKVAYGTLGGVAGGAVYVFSHRNRHTAHRIWNNSLGGDYVLTPEMVTGQEPIHFMGSASSSSSGAIAAPLTRKSASSSRVSLRQSVTVVNTAKATNWTVPISREIVAQHSDPATLEIPPLADRQGEPSDAKNESPSPGLAQTPRFESMPPMRIEPQ
jgi:hypothetical protein